MEQPVKCAAGPNCDTLSTMTRRLAPRPFVAFAAVLIITELLLGMRGLGGTDTDFFSMHPFSTPMMHCEVRAYREGKPLNVPESGLYSRVPGANFRGSFYLEFIPAYERAIAGHLRADDVRIDCTPVESV